MKTSYVPVSVLGAPNQVQVLTTASLSARSVHLYFLADGKNGIDSRSISVDATVNNAGTQTSTTLMVETPAVQWISNGDDSLQPGVGVADANGIQPAGIVNNDGTDQPVFFNSSVSQDILRNTVTGTWHWTQLVEVSRFATAIISHPASGESLESLRDHNNTDGYELDQYYKTTPKVINGIAVVPPNRIGADGGISPFPLYLSPFTQLSYPLVSFQEDYSALLYVMFRPSVPDSIDAAVSVMPWSFFVSLFSNHGLFETDPSETNSFSTGPDRYTTGNPGWQKKYNDAAPLWDQNILLA